MEKAKDLMSQVQSPKKSITLWYNEDPAHKAIAVAVQSMWKQLGINVTLKAQEFAQYLEFLGPPPNKAVDAFRLGWIGDYVGRDELPRAVDVRLGQQQHELLRQELRRARRPGATARLTTTKRYELYGKLEDKLLGENGAVPIIPIYWYTYVAARARDRSRTRTT